MRDNYEKRVRKAKLKCKQIRKHNLESFINNKVESYLMALSCGAEFEQLTKWVRSNESQEKLCYKCLVKAWRKYQSRYIQEGTK